MTHPAELAEMATSLVRDGASISAAARAAGVARSTVRSWLAPRDVVRPDRCWRCGHDDPTAPSEAYVYLLGMYLGDGYISPMKKRWRLRIVLDDRYPALIRETSSAMVAVLDGVRPTRV